MLDPEEVDDPEETLMKGSDEEFDDLEDLENGNTFSSELQLTFSTVTTSYRVGK